MKTSADALKHVEAASRSLSADEPDLTSAKRELAWALEIIMAITAPYDPYADGRLRPGLNRAEADVR